MIDTTRALKAAKELVEALKKTTGSPAEHHGLLKKADEVRRALDTPQTFITKQFEVISMVGAMNAVIKIGAHESIPAADAGFVTAKQLAKSCNVDESAITRMMRVALCNGIFEEVGSDAYRQNNLSAAFDVDVMGSFFHVGMDYYQTFLALPEYFKTHQPEDLYDVRKAPHVFAEGKEGMTYFEVIGADPSRRDVWNKAMATVEAQFPILGMFPFASLREQVAKEPERPFVVDIGGGRGHVLLKIQEDIEGQFNGKLILQDLPVVIDSLRPKDIPDIEPMAYDFFTPQPVKNAHVYFFRHVLHDWYNEPCIEMLKNTAQAMGPDSRLVVCDILVPDRVTVNELQELYWMDFALMTFGGKEKKLSEFEVIFNAAGLELVKVWPSDIGQTVQLETRMKIS